MTNLASTTVGGVAGVLKALAAHVDEVIGGLMGSDALERASDAELLAAVTAAGGLLRRVECVLVEGAGQIKARSVSADPEMNLAVKSGCRNTSELLQQLTRVNPSTVGSWERAAKAVHRRRSITTGELLPPVLPAMRDALIDGVVGVDGLLAVAGPLAAAAGRSDADALLAADQALADTARGDGAGGEPPPCAGILKIQATVWGVVLDPDGAEPRDRDALWHRGVRLGKTADQHGLIPLHGRLLPEVAAQLQRIFDALTAPRTADDTGGVRFRPEGDDPFTDAAGPLDDRRVPHQLHDAFATAVFAAAATGHLPTIGGAAPTLVVSVREEDLAGRTGWAHADGIDQPVPVTTAEHVGCAGVIQRVVTGRNGRILALGTEDRAFNRHQRRAIALRDGGCLIPGCLVPAAWCELHHVIEHSRGGPTHVDNGVLLCWWHHRHHERIGWRVRFRNGLPELRAPGWHDATLRWRHVTKSRTRLTDLLTRRE